MSEALFAPILSIESVSKRFGPVKAVDGVSLEIRHGEFFSLLGPSGCGKSTLMRMIAGFETPEAGRIMLDGADITATPPHLRPVNMMFQSYALFPHLTVAGNIAFGLKQMGMAQDALKARLGAMLDLVQLSGFEDRKPAALSGGQRQRVALARALAREPKVLLLDEPLGALDRKLRKETQSELKRIQAEAGATFIVVTHDQEEAMALSDRMAVMRDGRLVQVGPPTEIYERPVDRFVAGFIGEMNHIEAKARPDGGYDVAGLSQPVLQVGTARVPESHAGLMIRPERLTLSFEPLDHRPGWRVTVTQRTLLGHAVTLDLRTETGQPLQALVPSHDAAAAFRPGDAAFASFRPADACIVGD